MFHFPFWQEMRDLDNRYAALKKVMVDDAMAKLHDKYEKERDAMLKRHQTELAALQVGITSDILSLTIMTDTVKRILRYSWKSFPWLRSLLTNIWVY